MNAPQNNVDLTNCDREPIHRLGEIQDFGALLALTGDWMVAHRSMNYTEILGVDAPPEIGLPLAEYFTNEALERLARATSGLAEGDDVERLFDLHLLRNSRQTFDCAIHRSGHLTVLEIERHTGESMDRQMRILRPVLRDLDRTTGLSDLCQNAADKLRNLLNIDRVMVYRFRGDQSGEVIAEALNPGIDSFLGLRYPKTDIPAQARELYIRNRFRIIANVNAQPVAIEPGLDEDGQPIDLSMSTLRSVSRIHIEYLQNMGVEASLSISIVVDGKLWGLFACHHYKPLDLPFALRTAAELFSELFSLAVERAVSREQAAAAEVGRELHDRLMRSFVGGQSLVDALPALRPIIRRSIPHDGLSAFVDDHYVALGAAPDEAEFRALVPSLNATASSSLIASDCLADRFKAAQAFAGKAAGGLIIPVSRSPRDYIVLWRKDMPQTVNWAGNPEKPVELGPNGARLTPRQSFALWRESVSGRSEPWTTAEQGVAESLRVTLIEIILRLTDDLATARKKAAQQQELLIAELNHRVRNILNLIRSLIAQSRHEALDIDSFAEIVGGRISALASAHDNITRENWSAAPVKELIRTEAEAYATGKSDRIQIVGDEAMITPEGYTVLALVIHEMMTNSAKYGAICDSRGTLQIETVCDDSGLTITWAEEGGPPVKPPTRRGFGSTIIEKSIPFELNGSARVDYPLSGVTAEFWIPGRLVTCREPEDATSERKEKPIETTNTATMANRPKSILLVEDSMIIALDTEDCLRELGADTVQVSANVTAALDALERQEFDMALLDFNLGSESSVKVAKALAERNIPFWMATGYGEVSEDIQKLGSRGILTKPYGKDDLEKLMDEVAGAD